MPDDIRDEAASARDIPLLHRRLRRRRLPHRDLAHHRVHPQAPPRDIDGHGLGGVVFGRYRGCSQEEPEHKAGFAEVFSKGYAARIVFLGILTLCQVVPMYAIYTFGPQIMCAFGLGVGKSAILGESVLSLFFLVGSLPAMFWLNSMGRRPLLIRSLFLMAVGLLALRLFPPRPSRDERGAPAL